MTSSTDKALLLEPNDFDAAVTRELLEKCCATKFVVTRVASLSEAKRLLLRSEFDIVLSEMNVLDREGLSTVRELAQAGPEAPLVILSTEKDLSVAAEALRLGAQDYIPKTELNSPTLQRVVAYSRQRKAQERELMLKAYIDRLTGLGNRALLYDRWRRALVRSARAGAHAGLLILDIDHFGRINEAFGHDAGDQVLRHFAEELGRSVRESDIVARLGGDEFIVAIEAVADFNEAAAIRDKFAAAGDQRLRFGGQEIAYSFSIGCAVSDPGRNEDLMAVLKRADAELFEYKATLLRAGTQAA